jgi:hypothetical protein
MAMQDTDPEVRQAAGDALLAIGTQTEPRLENGEKISSRPAPTASPDIWRHAVTPIWEDIIIPANYVPAETRLPSAKPPVTLLPPMAGPSPSPERATASQNQTPSQNHCKLQFANLQF